MSLVCKKCGYKQSDSESIYWMQKRFPDMAEHDIPYYCGACQDEADDEEYRHMQLQMHGKE